jgi:hypothetical protein
MRVNFGLEKMVKSSSLWSYGADEKRTLNRTAKRRKKKAGEFSRPSISVRPRRRKFSDLKLENKRWKDPVFEKPLEKENASGI